MMTKHSDTEANNRAFYEQAYSARHLPELMAKQLLSYDQLSKTRRNLRVLRHLPNFSHEHSILDYGFGHGTLLLRLPRVHRIFGCELSAQAIKNIKYWCRLLHRDLTIHSSEELASAAELRELDVVCCSHVIEHVDDDKSLLGLFHNLLRPAGYLLLNVPINEVWRDPNHVRTYSLESVKTILNSTGFAVVEALEADRWTAWILHHEHVSQLPFKSIFRAVRLSLALLPAIAWDICEKMLPKRYKFQQLLVLAQKT